MPAVLYKHLKPKHADAMVRDGKVRIGTLFSYRALEDHDPERGDGGEGKLVLHSDPLRREYNSTDELPPVLRGIKCGPRGIVTEGERAIVISSAGPHMFVYCVSESDEEIFQRDPGNVCVRISEPHRFFQALDSALRSAVASKGRRIGELQASPCSYINRYHNYHAPLPPSWLLKPPHYADQREFRAGWTVQDGNPIDCVFVQSPAVAASCTILVSSERKETSQRDAQSNKQKTLQP